MCHVALPLLSRFKPYVLLDITFYTSNYELLATRPFCPNLLGVTFEKSRVAPRKKNRDPPLFSLQKVLKLNKVSKKIGLEKTTWVLITPRYSLKGFFGAKRVSKYYAPLFGEKKVNK